VRFHAFIERLSVLVQSIVNFGVSARVVVRLPADIPDELRADPRRFDIRNEGAGHYLVSPIPMARALRGAGGSLGACGRRMTAELEIFSAYEDSVRWHIADVRTDVETVARWLAELNEALAKV
jgi:hypothetical protein